VPQPALRNVLERSANTSSLVSVGAASNSAAWRCRLDEEKRPCAGTNATLATTADS
jgi:hypothetical protein